MGEHNEREKPKIYESIAPETRFVFIATTVLENIGQNLHEGDESMKIARWSNDQTGDHYKLMASLGTGMLGEPKILFILDHFTPDQPSNVPKSRYQAFSSAGGITPIKISDGKNVEKQLNTQERNEEIHLILSALTDASPEDASKILREAFSHRFESLAGVYALSDLALQIPQPQIDTQLLEEAYTNHEKNIEEIKQNELSKAKKRKRSIVDRSQKIPQPEYYDAVAEAAHEGRRGPTNRNTYEPVDVQKAMTRVVREMNGKWRNVITPET